MNRVIGIDFGTTCSRISFWDPDTQAPRIIPNLRGEPMTPSVVGLNDAGEVVVGEDARQIFVSRPADTIWQIKLELGRDLEVTLDGRTYSPQVISGLILRHLKVCAERYLKETVHDAVITVPAWFNESQRHAIRDAGMIAGFNVHRLVNEPTAAAIAYGITSGPEPGARKIFAVYDLGGATFDASIIEVTADGIKVIGTGGDRHLGGLDMDDEIVKWALHEIGARHGVDLHGDETARRRLMLEAEGVRKRLAENEVANLSVPSLAIFHGRPFDVKLAITRPQYETLNQRFLDRSFACLEEVVARSQEENHVGWKDLDGVLLIGGPTRLPRIGEMLRDKFRKEFREHGCPDRTFEIKSDPNPEEVVALGAAIVAAPLTAIGRAPGDITIAAAGEVEGPKDRRPPVGKDETVAPEIQIFSMMDQSAGPPPVKPLYLDENVQFSVFRPRAVEADHWHTLLAFAHLSERRPDAPASEPDPVAEVKKQARQILGEMMGEYQERTQDSRQAVPREGELTFLPEVPGVEFNPPRRSFLWLEPVHREEFRFRASAGSAGQTLRGGLSVFLGRILLADVPLVFRVETAVAKAPAPAQVAANSRPYRKIFASYSHRDVRIVEEFERYAIAVGDRFLRDWVELRAGEVWTERLSQMIEEADIFQLFWSTASMTSPFVRQEWECALSLGRPGFIRPVYWEDPFPESPDRTLPPAELRRLHFQRLSLPGSEARISVPPPGEMAGPGLQSQAQDSIPTAREELAAPTTDASPEIRRIDSRGLYRSKEETASRQPPGQGPPGRDRRVGELVERARAYLESIRDHPPRTPDELEQAARRLEELAQGGRALLQDASPVSSTILRELMEALGIHLKSVGEALEVWRVHAEFKAIVGRLQQGPITSPAALDDLERQLKAIKRRAEALPGDTSVELLRILNSTLERIEDSRRRFTKKLFPEPATGTGPTLMQVRWVGIAVAVIGLATFVLLLLLRHC